MTESESRASGKTAFDLLGAMWNVHVGMAATERNTPATLEERVKLLEEESAVRDALVRYTYFYDAKDPDGILTVFREDCVLINPRGTYVGHEAIRRNYVYLMGLSKVSMHFAPNALVRVEPSGHTAWLTGFYHDVSAFADGRLVGTGGTYADRLSRERGGWKIAARRITYNFRHRLTPEAPPAGSPPTPSKVETSRDIVGPTFEM
jgi:ketosteroid isomerase-like protein